MTNSGFDTTPEQLKTAEQDMLLAISQAMMHWAEIENDLAGVLESILGRTAMTYGLILYYTPGNTETRFDMVDNVVSKMLPTIALGDHLLQCWHKFVRQLHKARKSRNKIVHGNVRAYGKGGSGKIQPRLIPPVLDANNWFKDFGHGQWPGLSTHDVEAIGNHFNALRATLRMIFDAVGEVRRVPYDWRASTRKVRELRSHLNLGADPNLGLLEADPILPKP